MQVFIDQYNFFSGYYGSSDPPSKVKIHCDNNCISLHNIIFFFFYFREIITGLYEEYGEHHFCIAEALNNLAVLYCHMVIIAL